MTETANLRTCPGCGARGVGKFCSECGTAFHTAHCSRCGAELAAGSHFCAECGARASVNDSAVSRGARAVVTGPRIVAALAVVALVVIIAAQAGSRLGQANKAAANVAQPVTGAALAPNIDNMSPRERASRLYDRVMRLHEERKMDSVRFFAPMALSSYASITDIDDDARYDMARLAMVAGQLPVARAQADTILKADSTHLLGLLLAADVAHANGDETSATRYETKFVAAAVRERARKLPEYDAHGREIESVLTRLQNAQKPDGAPKQ